MLSRITGTAQMYDMNMFDGDWLSTINMLDGDWLSTMNMLEGNWFLQEARALVSVKAVNHSCARLY